MHVRAREMQRAMKVAATGHARFAKELRHLPSKKENLSSTPWRAKTYRQLRSPTNLEDISCGMRTTQVDLGTCRRRQVAGFNLSSRTKDKATWGRGAYLKIPRLIPGVLLLPDYYILTMRKECRGNNEPLIASRLITRNFALCVRYVCTGGFTFWVIWARIT